MLVATRDPMHSPGAHDGSPRPLASRSSRFMTAMQIAGSVLAIPVCLGSAYSVYHANFSVETTCQLPGLLADTVCLHCGSAQQLLAT